MNPLAGMNLSPAWVTTLRQADHVAHHWSELGAVAASDRPFRYA
jgi:predicted nuclease of predicted toxin-antitoxin system